MDEDKDMQIPGERRPISSRATQLVRRGLTDLRERANDLWSIEEIERSVASHAAVLTMEKLRNDARQNPSAEKLARKVQLLEAVAPNLDGWQIAAEPAFFLQQWRNCSHDLGWADLQNEAEILLRLRHLPYIQVVWRKRIEDKDPPRFSRIAVRPDGKYAAVTSGNGGIEVIDLASGNTKAAIPHFAATKIPVAFSSDGRFLAAAGYPGAIFDADSAEEIIHSGYGFRLEGVDVAPGKTGASFVFASDDTLRVIDANTKTSMLCHWIQFTVERLAISRSGRFAVVANRNKLLAWDLIRDNLKWSGSVQQEQEIEQRGDICGLAISVDERQVVVGYDRELQVWNAITGEQSRTIVRADVPLAAIAMTERYNHIVFAAAGPVTLVLEMHAGVIVRRLEDPGRNVIGLSASADGRFVATAGTDNVVRIWDWQGGVVVHSLSDAGTLVAFDHDARHILTASKTVKVWDVYSGSLLRVLEGSGAWAMGLDVSVDGQYVAVLDRMGICVWLLRTGQKWRQKSWPGLEGAMGFSGDGGKLCYGRRNWIWQVDLKTENVKLKSFGEREFHVRRVGVSPDGRYIITGGAVFEEFPPQHGVVLKVWDYDKGTLIAVSPVYAGRVSCLDISPDSRYVVVSFDPLEDGELWGSEARSWATIIYVWEFNTGLIRPVFRGHNAAVRSLSYSPDGRWLASVGEDGQLRVWDVAGERLAMRLPLGAPNGCCAFTPDSKIIVGDFSGYVQLLTLTDDA